jgi:Cu-processing system permease protein
MNPIWLITQLTFRESMRRRIVLTALLLGAAFLAVYSIGFHMINTSMQVGPTNAARSLVRSETSNGLLLAGLYAITFLSVAMAALLAADTLAGEINSGTIQTLVTKPIRRADIVLGKWLGFAGLLGLYMLLMAGGTAASVYLQSGYAAPNLPLGIALIYLESLLVMSISLACSSRISALATGGVVFGLWGLSFIGGWVEQIGAVLHNSTAVYVGIVTSLIIPSESLWRRAAFEMQSPVSGVLGISPFGTTSVPSLWMILYAVLYLCGALALAVRTFNRRDL